MCDTCGCQRGETPPAGRSALQEARTGRLEAADAGAGPARRVIEVERRVLAANDEQAMRNRDELSRRGVVALNVIS